MTNNFGKYCELNSQALNGVSESKLNQALVILRKLREERRTLWVIGNGGSASTSSHFVADLNKTILPSGNGSVRTIALAEMIALTSAYANDESFESGFSLMLENLAQPGDCLMIISVSGTSPNLLKAKDFAYNSGLNLISLVGSRGVDLGDQSTVGIVVPSEDYQIVENAHVAIMHWFVKAI
jgi:D-sedoheptulose 7-phosphate isomerase